MEDIMPKTFQFEKFQDSSNILSLLKDRQNRIINLAFEQSKETTDMLCIQDTRFRYFGGFPLYLKKDGTLTTNILEAIVMHKKKQKELAAFASSYQVVESLSYDELAQIKQEYYALSTNY